jgi:hypothetical protein
MSPEEKRRIYEEEKARIEACERIAAERRIPKGPGCCGIGCLVLLGAFALLILRHR